MTRYVLGTRVTGSPHGNAVELFADDSTRTIIGATLVTDAPRFLAGVVKPIAEILIERGRQLQQGYGTTNDDRKTNGELTGLAMWYAATPGERETEVNNHGGTLGAWLLPQGYEAPRPHELPRTRRQDLIIAAALILAEIERLDRAS